MDAIVEQALRKWPNVPACRGWLGLDARGDWYLRDDRVQGAGPFPSVKGSRLLHDKLLGFIGRNYERADDGAWFFQNGPQRVYVELEAAPWVWRVADDGDAARVVSQTGRTGRVASCWLDDGGRLFVDTEIGFGLVHTQDVHAAATFVERGDWQPQPLPFAAMPARFGYRLSPQADAAST